MSVEKLVKSYSPNAVKFRRNWANLFRDYSRKNKLQPSVVIVFISFVISVAISIVFNLGNVGALPFIAGVSFILISFIYFHFFPLSWEEMNDNERDAYRYFNQLPSDWEPK